MAEITLLDEPESGRDPEFRLTTKVSNARMIRMRKEMGLNSPKEAAKAIGVSYNTYLELENIRKPPLSKVRSRTTGKWDGYGWSGPAKKIAKFFGVSPDYLWPESVRALKSRTAVTDVTAHELATVTGHSRAVEGTDAAALADEKHRALWSALIRRLTRQERRVVEMRFFQGKTYREIAREIGTTRERPRQVEASALRKLRRAPEIKSWSAAADWWHRYNNRTET